MSDIRVEERVRLPLVVIQKTLWFFMGLVLFLTLTSWIHENIHIQSQHGVIIYVKIVKCNISYVTSVHILLLLHIFGISFIQSILVATIDCMAFCKVHYLLWEQETLNITSLIVVQWYMTNRERPHLKWLACRGRPRMNACLMPCTCSHCTVHVWIACLSQRVITFKCAPAHSWRET
jgi:apolipoprotein N-acyltransferase